MQPGSPSAGAGSLLLHTAPAHGLVPSISHRLLHPALIMDVVVPHMPILLLSAWVIPGWWCWLVLAGAAGVCPKRSSNIFVCLSAVEGKVSYVHRYLKSTSRFFLMPGCQKNFPIRCHTNLQFLRNHKYSYVKHKDTDGKFLFEKQGYQRSISRREDDGCTSDNAFGKCLSFPPCIRACEHCHLQ